MANFETTTLANSDVDEIHPGFLGRFLAPVGTDIAWPDSGPAVGTEEILSRDESPGSFGCCPQFARHGPGTDRRGEKIGGAAVARFLQVAAAHLALQQENRDHGIEHALAPAGGTDKRKLSL